MRLKNMKKAFKIAVDGPSGSGKSTIAKKVAKKLEIEYIDTGAMYRAVGYKMICEGISRGETNRIREILSRTEIDFRGTDIFLDGICISNKIRTPEVAKMASSFSALPEVREKLVELQRKMAGEKSIIMDGRDIGTNVLSDAEYKVFLTASIRERALRRWKEMKDKGEEISLKQVEDEMIQRDFNDATRTINPLRKAKGALEIDTTEMTIEEVVETIIQSIK
ncbi:(d)CMP kinase [Sinanaerobacter sp. ZZT-01]|uniref:(d)CMP kinase n=1 Tax=Sinanaerobacter sp. ZZT-01 TaxID=3111540 RepID=UPI002D76D1C5|nr:(d)CMP kinase [Sinanaerobacter sp. ZZT-01]WRR92606.1 (d)CMP kinase [Sinanaerobacter sp. ZZT-01]